jgi:hypothetical protein
MDMKLLDCLRNEFEGLLAIRGSGKTSPMGAEIAAVCLENANWWQNDWIII